MAAALPATSEERVTRMIVSDLTPEDRNVLPEEWD